MDPDGIKSGFAAIIGRPNVGKSTLLNRMAGQKIAITSDKPQTTRNDIRAIYTSDEGQIVFIDTPGITKAKNRLGTFMLDVAKRTVSSADVVLWLVEADTFTGPQDRAIAEMLSGIKTPVILVINKIDRIGRDELLIVIDKLKDLCDFSEIVPISAAKGDGVDILKEQIFKYLPEDIPYYDEDTVTDQTERQIVAEIVREKALKCLKEEIPHGIACVVDSMKEEADLVNIEATIICEKDSHKGMIIGKGGAMIKKIGSAARYEMEQMLDCKVNLKLWVKVKKDWRDSQQLLKNFGYDQNE